MTNDRLITSRRASSAVARSEFVLLLTCTQLFCPNTPASVNRDDAAASLLELQTKACPGAHTLAPAVLRQALQVYTIYVHLQALQG
jgi:hypothetical protein